MYRRSNIRSIFNYVEQEDTLPPIVDAFEDTYEDSMVSAPIAGFNIKFMFVEVAEDTGIA